MTEKSSAPKVPGCRLYSFPASVTNINVFLIICTIIYVPTIHVVVNGIRTNLSFSFKSVCVKAINVVEHHVVIKRYIGTAGDNIMRSCIKHM